MLCTNKGEKDILTKEDKMFSWFPGYLKTNASKAAASCRCSTDSGTKDWCYITSSVSWQRGFPTQVDVANTERALQEMRGLISSMQQEIAAAVEEKRSRDEEEERQKQKELLKKEQMSAQTPAPAQQSGGKQQKEGWLGFSLPSPRPSPYTLLLLD